jgi:allantoicase
VALHAGFFDPSGEQALEAASLDWPELLPEKPLSADTEHEYVDELASPGSVSHVRMSIYPDGGVSRLRLFGRVRHAGARR